MISVRTAYLDCPSIAQLLSLSRQTSLALKPDWTGPLFMVLTYERLVDENNHFTGNILEHTEYLIHVPDGGTSTKRTLAM
jgi:hypothetical protein